MIASFFAGIVIGACALAFIASRFVGPDRPAEADKRTISAIGLDMHGRGGPTIETSIPSDKLRNVFKQLENGAA